MIRAEEIDKNAWIAWIGSNKRVEVGDSNGV